MKNMKVKKKLIASFSIVICLSLVIAIAGAVGMRQLDSQLDVIIGKTMPNVERVAIMQRNLQAEVNELLLAMNSLDPNVTTQYLNSAREKISENEQLLETIKAETKIDPALITKLEDIIARQGDTRNEFRNLVALDTVEGNQKAQSIMDNRFIPLLIEERDALQNIADAQKEITNVRVEKSENLYRSLMTALVILVVVSLVLCVVVIGKLVSAIMVPLNLIKNGVEEFEKGNFNYEMDYTSRDELGETCQSVVSCQHVLKAVVDDACYLLGEMARGNFDVKSRAKEQYVGGLKPMIESMADINRNLSDTLTQIDLGAEQVAAGADQVSTGAQALAQGATEQASAVQELSATINEISANSQKNAENSALAMEHSRKAGGFVTESADNINEMVQAMKQISDSSQEISKIIATIENIAFQTNILALNAAVEAARAGSAGKGFAVVADEVRNLAAKSDEAAKATKELISSSIDSVKHGDAIVQRVSESLESTIAAAKQAEADIENITHAIKEEAEAVAQVTEGIDQISSVVQTNSATSEESAAASEELSSQAALMKELMGKFQFSGSSSSYTPAQSGNAAYNVDSKAESGSFAQSSFDKY